MGGAAATDVAKDTVDKGVTAYLESEHAKQSMDATKRGGVMANYSCMVIISDEAGTIDRVTYHPPQDGEWKETPAPVRNGTVCAFLQDGKFVGAEGTVAVTVGLHQCLVRFGCPLVASENYANFLKWSTARSTSKSSGIRKDIL